MKKLFFILIAIFAISCNKEETIPLEYLYGTYQFETDKHGFVTMTVEPDNASQVALMLVFDDTLEHHFVHATEVNYSSDKIVVDASNIRFSFYNNRDIYYLQMSIIVLGEKCSYVGPITKIGR